MKHHYNSKELRAVKKQRWESLSAESKARKLESIAERELEKPAPFASFKTSCIEELLGTKVFASAPAEVKECVTKMMEARKNG